MLRTAAQGSLAVALHAQAAPSDGLIVGSVMTTHGLKRALERQDRVRLVRIFYPFHYEGLDTEEWDILIIEGWFEMMFALIHEVRRSSHRARVLFWCLDPEFPGLDAIMSIDVDAYLTNSETTRSQLATLAPTTTLLLGFDREECSSMSRPGTKLIYVGSALGLSTKHKLLPMLLEAARSTAGLELWGSGWGSVGPAELADCCWRGVLPHGELGRIYGEALAVLGATMDGQREAGMINNRVFEALGGGAVLIQESFPALDDLLGHAPNLFAYQKEGDVEAAVATLLSRTEQDWAKARLQTLEIMEAHTYDARAIKLLDFLDHDVPSRRPNRHARLRLAIVYDAQQPQLFASFGAAAGILASDMAISWLRHDDLAEDLLSYDIVLAVGFVDGQADLRVRRLTTDFTLSRRLEQRRILVLLDGGNPPIHRYRSIVKPPNAVYDAVCYASSSDNAALLTDLAFRPFSLEPGCYATFDSAPPKHNEQVSSQLYDVVVATDVGVPIDAVASAAAGSGGEALVAVLAEQISASWLKRLRESLNNSKLQLVSDVEQFEAIAASSANYIVPHPPSLCLPPSGQWAIMAGLKYSKIVQVYFADNDRLRNIDTGVAANSHADFARKLSFAITRAFTLGRAAARLDLRAPPFIRPGEHLPFDIAITSFIVGRDGSWCLHADPGGQVACILQPQLKLILSLKNLTANLGCTDTFKFFAILKSNLYSDVLLRSNTVTVTLDLSIDGSTNSSASNTATYAQTEVLFWQWDVPPCSISHHGPSYNIGIVDTSA